MESFAKIVNIKEAITIFAKSSILDVRLGFQYASKTSYPEMFNILLVKKVSGGKELGELKNEFSQMFDETSRNELSLLSDRGLYIISLIKKVIKILVYQLLKS